MARISPKRDFKRPHEPTTRHPYGASLRLNNRNSRKDHPQPACAIRGGA